MPQCHLIHGIRTNASQLFLHTPILCLKWNNYDYKMLHHPLGKMYHNKASVLVNVLHWVLFQIKCCHRNAQYIQIWKNT